MRLIKEIEKVSFIDSNDKFVFASVATNKKKGDIMSHGNKIICLESDVVVNELKQEHFYFMSFLDGFIFNEAEGGEIYYNNLNSIEKIISKGYYIDPLQYRSSNDYFIFSETDENFNTSFLIFNSSKEIISLPRNMKLGLTKKIIDFNRASNQISCFDVESIENKWAVDLAVNYNMDRNNRPFGDESSVFVPMDNGGLLGINLDDGTINWKWFDNDEIHVTYCENGKNIYQNYGRGIIEINKATGLSTRELIFNKIENILPFQASGPIWCFEFILIVVDVFSGKLLIFSRESFEVIDCFQIEKSSLPSSRGQIIYINGILYVLGNNNSLKIFELNYSKEDLTS